MRFIQFLYISFSFLEAKIMNKIFKIVFNAARGKMMVVNEATSSVQTGKKAAVTVAVVGALASGMAMASDTVFDGLNKGMAGGALSNTNADQPLVLDDYQFTNNTAKSNGSPSNGGLGGAVYSTVDLTVENSSFDSNVAVNGVGGSQTKAKGGALYHQNGQLDVVGSTFTSNHSDTFGGAIAVSYNGVNASATIVNITDSFFGEEGKGNTSDSNGGAIHIQGAQTTLSGNTFIGNASLGGGGAVMFRETAVATFEDENRFEGNSSGTHGGAVRTHDSGATVTFAEDSVTTFQNNKANTSGGAIRNEATVTFEEGSTVTFAGNESVNGGAIANAYEGKATSAPANLTLNGNSSFSGNKASTDGGAIYNGVGANLIVAGSSEFVANTADGKGGAIYNEGTMTLKGTSVFSGNIAAEGNDIYNAGTLNVEGTTTLGSGFVNVGTLTLSDEAELVVGGDSSIAGTFITEKGSVVTLQDEATLALSSKAEEKGGVIKNLTIEGDGHVDIATSGTALYTGTNTINVNGDVSIVSKGKAISGYGSQLISGKNVYIEAEDAIFVPDDKGGRGGEYVKIVDFDELHIKGADYGIVNNAYTTDQPFEMVIKGNAGSSVLIENDHETKAAIQNYSAKVAVNENHNAETLVEAGTITVKSPGYAVITRAGLVNLKAEQVKLEGKVYADNGDLTVDANKIDLTAATVAVNARNGAQVMLGTEETDSVSIKVDPTDPEGVYAMGIQVRNPDTVVTVKGNQLNVTVGGGENDTSVGVLVQGNADGKSGTKMGELNLASANTTIVANDNAMVAYAAGVLNVTGNLTATAENVVEARGQSTVNINTAGGKDVVLNGDINFNKGAASGTDAWADVNVVLDTANSVWNGNVKATWDVPATAEDFAGSKLNLTLANGAQWNPQAIEAVGSLGEATTFALRSSAPTGQGQFALGVNGLTMEGGVLNLQDGVQVGVNNLEGSGGTVNLGTTNGETGAGLDVGTLSDETKLDVNLMNSDLSKELTSDDLTPEQTQELLKNVAGGSANVTTEVQEGMYNDGYTSNGKDGVVATKTNSVMSNTLDLASAAPLAMNRLLMNDVRKRMGDLRAAEGTHGVWARYDGGKLSGANGLENDFTTVQVGIDTVPVADAPRFGVAFAYTKSDTDMARGSADMDAFSLAFYGTKMYDNGMFVDVIGRMATADTDVTVDGNKKGTMDNVALSLSGELGWRFDVTDKFFFEPQAELTYTYVNADKLALGSSSYEFDAVDSLMARVGFAAGFKCPSNFGDVYVRASAVHEFLGDAAVTGANGTIHEVDGKDTWVEFGIGANFNVNKNTYVYVDIERTEGAKLEEDWRANVGVRFAF